MDRSLLLQTSVKMFNDQYQFSSGSQTRDLNIESWLLNITALRMYVIAIANEQ
jgi:hypothetical protein